MRPLLNHRDVINTGGKRVGKASRDNTEARESILEEYLAKKCELELTPLPLLEKRTQGEEATKQISKITRAEKNAGL